MAKLALKNREAKRAKTVAKYAAKRAELLAIINNAKLSVEERMEARLKFQQLPQFESRAPAQSLRTDWPPTWLLP